MLILILLVGFLFLGLVVRLAEGALRIVLILVVLVVLALGSIFSGPSTTTVPATTGPSTSLEMQWIA